ncbi:unnamed protein product [Cuscuta epithymum]|uniref:Ubiquitin-like domain-containing protein n=1 Tax=Cuscuta epithymum TaxID=186058 RepID=A0AAV0EBP1_9ASTE|nr:unnamed protein product [Cuscuta epithymum]
MAENGDEVIALLYWGGEILKTGHLCSVDYSEPPKTMCFLPQISSFDELVAKVHSAMDTTKENADLGLYGKYLATFAGDRGVFVSIPLTDDRSWRWFMRQMLPSQPLHIYVNAAAAKQRENNEGQQRKTSGAATMMKIYVRTPTWKTIALDVISSGTIRDMKESIKELEGIPIDDQLLYFQQTCLHDGCTLANYNIQSGSTLFLSKKLFKF